MKKFALYLALFALFAGSVGSLHAADDPSFDDYPPSGEEEAFFFEEEDEPSLEEDMVILNSLEESDPILLFEKPTPDLKTYLNKIDRINSVQKETDKPELYSKLIKQILEVIKSRRTSSKVPTPQLPTTQEEMSPDIAEAILETLDPSVIYDSETTTQKLENLLVMIESVRTKKNDSKLYAAIESLVQSTIEGKAAAQKFAVSDTEKAILNTLEQNPAALSAPKAHEIKKYLGIIKRIRRQTEDPSAYSKLEKQVQSKKEQLEDSTRTAISILKITPSYAKFTAINSYPVTVLKNMFDYMWHNGLANDPGFKNIYQLVANTLLRKYNQTEKNNIGAFGQNAQFIPLPTLKDPYFGFFIVNMNTIDVDGHPIIQQQVGDDCGFHTAFNGLELYRFAKGLINQKELEDLLPNFNVNEWKMSDKYSCRESDIGSGVIDTILESHGLTKNDYSIVESIEKFNIDMDIVQKLALTLFDQNVKQFSHLIVINSIDRKHWTVAVVNKTDDQIRVYTADSLYGEEETAHIKEIMQLLTQINVKGKKFEALMEINRVLLSIENIQSSQEIKPESKNESTIINLLSMLPTLYTTNVTNKSYFLHNFSSPILGYVNARLPDQPFSLLGSIGAQLGIQPTPPPKATGIVKRMLEQLRTVIRTTDLPNLPPLNFEQAYNTIQDKYAFVTLLELYLIKNKLATTLADASAQEIAKILDAIQTVRIYKEDNKVLKDLQNAIPIRDLPDIDLDKEYQSTDEMIYPLAQLEMYRAVNQLEKLLERSDQKQISNILNAIQMIRSAFNFRLAFDDLEKTVRPFKQEEKE